MHHAIKIAAAFAMVIGLLGIAASGFVFAEANSAPKQAAGAAMVMAPVISFYVVARALEMLGKKDA